MALNLDAISRLNPVGVLTVLVVLIYAVVSAMVFVRMGISWQDFSGAIGPIAGTLVGYWLRGSKDDAA